MSSLEGAIVTEEICYACIGIQNLISTTELGVSATFIFFT